MRNRRKFKLVDYKPDGIHNQTHWYYVWYFNFYGVICQNQLLLPDIASNNKRGITRHVYPSFFEAEMMAKKIRRILFNRRKKSLYKEYSVNLKRLEKQYKIHYRY